MKVDRKKLYIGKRSKNDEGYVKAPAAQRVSFIWDLTAELWSFKKPSHAQRRLQRNIVTLANKRT
jgi:hypothetical protein